MCLALMHGGGFSPLLVEQAPDWRDLRLPRSHCSGAVRPLPVADLRPVDAVFECVSLTIQNLILQPFLAMCPDNLQSGDSIDDINGKIEAVRLIIDRQPQRSVDAAALDITAHMQI